MVLDACCGSKAFWFDKEDARAVFMDCRAGRYELHDRVLTVSPDIVADFRNMPFPSEAFNLVVFDPPHLIRAGDRSRLALKYGKLSRDWRDDLQQGFRECFRVLIPNGVLVFKWNETQIPLKEVLTLTEHKPLFGDQRSKTRWIVFMKPERED